MILLYTVLLLLLAAVKLLADRRAAGLERKFCRAATEADALLKQASYKGGNRADMDPYKVAKRQYVLGHLVHKQDRYEARYDAAQALAEKLGRALTAVREWKGKKLPYTFGVVDVSFLLYLIDHLGVGELVNARYLVEAVTSLISQ